MTKYYITGVWKDSTGTISHYSFHLVDTETNKFGVTLKTSKLEAIQIVESYGTAVVTLVWNYTYGTWNTGEAVYVAGAGTSKYLKSNPDNRISDNLGHLICWPN